MFAPHRVDPDKAACMVQASTQHTEAVTQCCGTVTWHAGTKRGAASCGASIAMRTSTLTTYLSMQRMHFSPNPSHSAQPLWPCQAALNTITETTRVSTSHKYACTTLWPCATGPGQSSCSSLHGASKHTVHKQRMLITTHGHAYHPGFKQPVVSVS